VSEQDTGHFLDEHIASTVTIGHGRVDGMRREVSALLLDSFFDRDSVNDIFLSAILHSNETKLERNFLVHNHTLSVHSSIHDIYFGDDTDSSESLRV
jgi:hypothetical protein